uniref:GPI ethanolamine phosphate transferase 3 n=1 Tax=Caenorhabditis japonica TaxID=281687 RepID=A0A8R1EQP3_CAEJA
MDKIIAQAANSMRKDDLLVVIGDHGMTATGDHGGESDLEVRAGIL